MNVSELVHVIRARWRLIGALVVAGLVCAVVVTVLTPKTYESFTNVYITSQGSGDNLSTAYQGGLLSQERVKSYTELITSRRLADDVKNDLGLPDPPQQIADQISASATVDTVLITIRVDTHDPQRSAAIADSAGTNFVRLVAEIEAPLNRSQPPAVAARVVQKAAVDTSPVSPSYAIDVVLGLLVGLALGVAAALVVHRRDRSVKGPKQAEELTGAPVIGSIPHDTEIESDRLPVHSRPRSSIAESFRQVRTNLRFTTIDARSPVFVVASSVPGEGKSTTACNLAIAFAKDGSRVVLVEADLRRPRLASYLGLESTVGLSTLLSRQINLDMAIQSWGGILSVVTSGYLPPNPSELLGSATMQEVLAELRSRFDVVILDATPLRAVTDSAVLAGISDGALLVCRDGVTDASDVSRSAADLERVSARLVGLVMVGGRGKGSGSSGYYEYSSIPPEEPPPNASGARMPPAPMRPAGGDRAARSAVSFGSGETTLTRAAPGPTPRNGNGAHSVDGSWPSRHQEPS